MRVDEFLALIDDKCPPPSQQELEAFERAIGAELPDDYRRFLIVCNGGRTGGRVYFNGETVDGDDTDVGVNDIGGLRHEYSLAWHHKMLAGRLPAGLIRIMGDPFGNAICLGVAGKHRGRVYFWDHEFEPDEDEWDGEVEAAGNVLLLADSFAEFVAGLREREEW